MSQNHEISTIEGKFHIITNYEAGGLFIFQQENSKHYIFIPPQKYNKAIHEDIVNIKLISGKETPIDTEILQNINQSLKSDVIIEGTGEVTEIISRNDTQLCGILNIKSNVIYGVGKNNNRFYLFKPCDRKYPTFTILTKIKPDQYNNNIYIVIKFMKWDDNDKYPRGACEDIIGEVGDFKSEITNRLYINNLVIKQPKKSIIQKEINEILSTKPVTNRLDLRNKDVLSIDPVGCSDVDDAIHIEYLENGFLIGVHIADVSSIVASGSVIDLDARKKMTSLYLPNEIKHMLPPDLSENHCSLLQGVDRNALSLIIKVDKSGNIYHYEFLETLINNKSKLTYEEAEKLISKNKHKDLRNLLAVTHLLKSKYQYLSTSEYSESPLSHMIIETFMIIANVFCAEHLVNKYGNCILRIHPESNYQSLQNQVDNLCQIYKTTDDDFQIVNQYLKKKSQQVAEYHPYNQLESKQIRHFGLNVKYYTHFTSPIRRYIDLVNHRLIKGQTQHLNELQNICEVANTINLRTKRLSRDLSYLSLVKTLEALKQNEINTVGYIIDLHNQKKSKTLPTPTSIKITIYLPTYNLNIPVIICHSKIVHLYDIEQSSNQISLYEKITQKQYYYDLFSKIKVELISVMNSNLFSNKLKIKINNDSQEYDYYQDMV